METFMETPLHTAVEEKQYMLVFDLLLQRVDVNARSAMYGHTPLFYAVRSQCVKILELIIIYGADVNARDHYNYTPLHDAVKYSNVHVAELLVQAGANVDAVDCDGYTPLHLAVKSKDVGMVEFLLNAGTRVNTRSNYYGASPLHNAVKIENVRISELLLDHGADIHAEDDSEHTPVHFAIEQQNERILKLLLKAGADVNAKYALGYTLLHVAAFESNSVNIFKLLLNAGASPTEPNDNDYSPLFLTTFQFFENDKRERIFRLLVEYSDINYCDADDENVVLDILQSNHLPKVGEHIFQTIFQHLAKLRVLELPVHPDLNVYIAATKDNQDYFDCCVDELKRVKRTKLHNCWVTFFDLLVHDRYQLVKYAGNEDLIQDFKRRVGEFPNFRVWLENKVNDGVESRRVFDDAASVLSYIWPIFNPSHLVVRNTLDALTEEDWKTLLE